jgi:hypothetical protein
VRTRSRHDIPASIPATFITLFAVSSCPPRSGFGEDSDVESFALAPAEKALFEALERRGVRFLVVGMGAALLEGAPLATQDIDLWFERLDDERIRDAAVEAGGFWLAGFGMQPPGFGGDGLDRIDVVSTAHGLGPFDEEYAACVRREVEGVLLPVLPLERVIASKRSILRPKDAAQLPALEATLAARRTS